MTRAHGTNAKYVVDKCRCQSCRKANRDAENYRARHIAYGTWQPYIDAEPVRAHVRTLMDFGIGYLRIADQAGIPRSTIGKLIYGDPRRGQAPSKRVRPSTASKLLAIQAAPERLGTTIGVDPTGTRRRIQALVAMGWPLSQIGARIGIHRSNIGNTLTAPKVRASTDRAVLALYEQLWNADPRQHGVSLHSYNRARNYAAAHGWAPVGAWDDDTIDNPTAFPDWTGRCGTPAGVAAHRHAGLLPACQPCRDAHNAHRRARKAKAAA